MARGNPQAAYKLTLAGKDITSGVDPRLISLQLTEKRDGSADELSLVLHDHDGKLDLPADGMAITLQLGWDGGALVDKGRFTVDEVGYDGAPDTINVRARSADFTSDIKTRRERSWSDTTLGAVLGDIAGAHGLTLACDPDLSAIAVPVLQQSRESDVAFLKRLGRDHDAVATIKAGRLIFSPVGKGETPVGGADLPHFKLTRQDGDQHSYRRIKRDAFTGVTAAWHDVGAARRKTTTAGAKGKVKRLRKTFATKDAAERAAKAERSRLDRGAATFSFNLARGRAELSPEQRITVSGFKPEIDAKTWLISEVTHSLDGRAGLTTSLQLETA